MGMEMVMMMGIVTYVFPNLCDRSLLPEYSDGVVSGTCFEYLELAIQFGLVTLFAPGMVAIIWR